MNEPPNNDEGTPPDPLSRIITHHQFRREMKRIRRLNRRRRPFYRVAAEDTVRYIKRFNWKCGLGFTLIGCGTVCGGYWIFCLDGGSTIVTAAGAIGGYLMMRSPMQPFNHIDPMNGIDVDMDVHRQNRALLSNALKHGHTVALTDSDEAHNLAVAMARSNGNDNSAASGVRGHKQPKATDDGTSATSRTQKSEAKANDGDASAASGAKAPADDSRISEQARLNLLNHAGRQDNVFGGRVIDAGAADSLPKAMCQSKSWEISQATESDDVLKNGSEDLRKCVRSTRADIASHLSGKWLSVTDAFSWGLHNGYNVIIYHPTEDPNGNLRMNKIFIIGAKDAKETHIFVHVDGNQWQWIDHFDHRTGKPVPKWIERDKRKMIKYAHDYVEGGEKAYEATLSNPEEVPHCTWRIFSVTTDKFEGIPYPVKPTNPTAPHKVPRKETPPQSQQMQNAGTSSASGQSKQAPNGKTNGQNPSLNDNKETKKKEAMERQEKERKNKEKMQQQKQEMKRKENEQMKQDEEEKKKKIGGAQQAQGIGNPPPDDQEPEPKPSAPHAQYRESQAQPPAEGDRGGQQPPVPVHEAQPQSLRNSQGNGGPPPKRKSKSTQTRPGRGAQAQPPPQPPPSKPGPRRGALSKMAVIAIILLLCGTVGACICIGLMIFIFVVQRRQANSAATNHDAGEPPVADMV